MQRRSCENEFGRKGRWVWGGGGVMGNMLRRGESSWLFVKFELGFIAGHGSLIRVVPCSFLALTGNELCLHFLPHPCATWCFALHILCKRFPEGIFLRFVGRCEISWFLDPNEISLRDLMVFS